MGERDYILNAALKQFAAHGYRRTALKKVADEVGLGKSALTHYFKDKQDIFKAVVEREGSDVLAGLQRAVEAEKDPRRKLRTYCIERYKMIADITRSFQVSEKVREELLESSLKMRISFFEREQVILWDIIREGSKAGIFKNVNSSLMAFITQQLFQKIEFAYVPLFDDEALNKSVDFALDILFHGLEVRGD